MSMSRSLGPWRMSSSGIRRLRRSFGGQVEIPVEAVVEHAIVKAIMHAHDELERGIAGIFDVDRQDLVSPPVRHGLVERDAGKFLCAEFHLERVIDDFAFDADAHGPIQLDSRMEIGEHRELPHCDAHRPAPS